MVSGDKFLWTHHSRMKMAYYRLTESRLKRIIRYPARVEEGILEDAIACMQPSSGKKYDEIWVMYVLVKDAASRQHHSFRDGTKKIKIITAWRYPGKSPARDPIPVEILREIKNIL